MAKTNDSNNDLRMGMHPAASARRARESKHGATPGLARVARAKQLVGDDHYPSDAIIDQIAGLLAASGRFTTGQESRL